MKNKALFIVLALLTSVFAGCSEDENSPAAEITAAVNNYTAADTDRIVTGEVIKITGNEVTIAVGVSDSDGNTEENETPQSPEKGDMHQFGEDKGERPTDMPDFGGEMPEFDGRSGGRGERKKTSIEKTGAEETFIIPVGMPIDGLTGRQTDYSGISQGMVITLTVNSRGNVCAASAE